MDVTALIILFQLYGSKSGLFGGNLFWVGQNDCPQALIQFLHNLSSERYDKFGKNIMMMFKKTQNKALHSLQTIYFLKYILSVKAWIF